jgi:hypothetical protein
LAPVVVEAGTEVEAGSKVNLFVHGMTQEMQKVK